MQALRCNYNTLQSDFSLLQDVIVSLIVTWEWEGRAV